MLQTANEKPLSELSPEIIKQILVTANARPGGLILPVTKIANIDLGYIQPNSIDGDIIMVKVTENFIGFAVSKNDKVSSYSTDGPTAREGFLTWLKTANKNAASGKEYGNPGNIATFKRSV